MVMEAMASTVVPISGEVLESTTSASSPASSPVASAVTTRSMSMKREPLTSTLLCAVIVDRSDSISSSTAFRGTLGVRRKERNCGSS